MMEQFFHFWSDEFKSEQRELGCAIHCMSQHFKLLTSSSKMHHENTDKFFKSFPSGEVLSMQMVAMRHGCEQQAAAEDDHCWRILHRAECFKTRCKERGLAPAVDLMMAEFIMEAE